MDYTLLHARNRKIIEASSLYIEVKKRRGVISKTFASQLAAYRLPLSAITEDEHLGKIAEYTLEAVNAALDYAKTRDDTDLQRIETAHIAADKLFVAFGAELKAADGDDVGT